MANSSQSPLTGLSGFRSEPPSKRGSAKLQTVPPPQSSSAAADESTVLPVTGPRKLVRPTLSARALGNRRFLRRGDPPILAYQHLNGNAPLLSQESSNAESFYFQKQVQAQTPMVIVLEDGQQVEGWIEWYDRDAIKVRGKARVLVYKAGIKYLYKAGEKRP